VSTVVPGWPVAFRGSLAVAVKGALLLFDHRETAMTRP
jgi:hypothetical protein